MYVNRRKAHSVLAAFLLSVSDTMASTSDGDRPWQSYHTVFTNAKAGMDGVDKEKVQKTVYEMSKGSKYFENEQRKEAFSKQKIENLRAQCAQITANDISYFQTIADKKMSELEASRDLSKIWLHSDMDAFYASVETLVDPSLNGKPLAVGSMSMICTANYEARKFGVRAAMPGFIAHKLCPELIFVPPDFKKYTFFSELTRKVFQKYDPHFIATSLDEAYINVTEICNERGISGGEVAEELRNTIYEETGLTCSVGVAPNRLLAKVSSDINKPNGQFVLPNDRRAVMAFISSLPIRKIGGIGKVTESMLREVLGISTCEEMVHKSAHICALFSHSSSDFFLSVGLGLGKTDTPQFKMRKSISSERTFSATEDQSLLYQKLDEIAETLSNDMHKEGLSGRTLTLKLKTASFEVRTRAVSLQKYINSKQDILSHASKLLKAELPLSLRLMGLRMSQFRDDKSGSVDRSQRTLTEFVTSRDASHSVGDDDHSSCSTVNENNILHDDAEGNNYSGDDTFVSNNGLDKFSLSYDFGDPSHPNHLSDVEHEYCTRSTTGDMIHSIFTFTENGESPLKLDANRLEENNDADKFLDKKASNQEQPFWIEDYRCSLCGIELPPCFVEERQEHSDYHLAERLQREESMHNSGGPAQKQRFVRKAQPNAAKKRKSSTQQGKHISIDSFFIKRDQNM